MKKRSLIICMALILCGVMLVPAACVDDKTSDGFSKTDYPFRNLSAEYTIEDATIPTYHKEGSEMPYVELETFIAALDGLFDDTDLQSFVSEASHEYFLQYTGEHVYTMVANWENDTIRMSSLDFFGSFVQAPATDYAAFLQPVVTWKTGESDIVFDLGEYGFDILYHDGQTLFPFYIVNLLFCSFNLYNVYFNGEAYYGIESFARCLGLECDFSGFVRTANGSARSGAGGLSFYFPSNVSADHSGYLDMFDGEEYTAFLREYIGAVPMDTISFSERGFIDEESGLFGFSLDPACLSYVQSVQYQVHLYGELSAEDGASSRLYCIGTDNDVLLSGSRFLTRFTGKWVYLDGILLHCDVLARSGDLTVFYSPVTVNGEFSYLLFRYSQAEGAAIEGVLDGDGSTARIRPLAEGDEIAVLYDAEQGEGERVFEEGSTVYGAQTKLTVQALPAGEYQIVPIVTDIYGNVFNAYTAAISFDGASVTNIEISAG